MYRPAIGLIAIVLLLAGLATRGQTDQTVSGGCLRMGVVMAIWWFAAPQMRGIPKWMAISCGVALLMVMLQPKLILLAVPVLIVLWFLRPRGVTGKKRPARSETPQS
jgi:hypothetical protein